MHISKLIRNLLVLITVVGLVLTGWLVGHILRHLTPSYRHPPIEEIDPHIENGLDFEGIRRQVVLTGNPASSAFVIEGPLYLEQFLSNQCLGSTYYTSLPAKCRSADGELVILGGWLQRQLVAPQDK